MAYWLVKSEPSVWSWDQQVAKGAKGEAWTGVRNFTARQNLVAMKKGDKAFYYHSNEGKEIVGIAEVIREAYPDPTDKTGKFVCVDIKADKPLKTPVTMAALMTGDSSPRMMSRIRCSISSWKISRCSMVRCSASWGVMGMECLLVFMQRAGP